ncbi:hypothetical protein HAX54_052022, partial [Datura stramonium]|nr:hypothetical protein [Datura stramonium]
NALGMATIGSSPVRSRETPMEHRFDLTWKDCCPSLLFFIGGSARFRGYHPIARR